MQKNKKYTFDRVVRIGITLLILYIIFWFLDTLSDALFPFIVAMLLAYCINPLVNLIQIKLKNRTVSVFLSLFIVFIALITALWLIIPRIVNEISSMRPVITEVVTNSSIAEKASKQLPPDLWKAFKKLIGRKEVQDFFKTDKFWEIASASAKKVLPGIWGFITGTTSFLISILGISIIGLYLVFLLIDYEKFNKGWKEMLPPAYKKTVLDFIGNFNFYMNGYFRAQALVAFITGCLFSIGFMIIGLPMSIILGMFIGLLNMVPYLQLIGLVPAVILAIVCALKTGYGIWAMIGLTLSVFVVAQLIQDTILVPKIMGDITGLSPVAILLSLSIWGKLLGIFGMIIALPMSCLVLAYYKQFIANPQKNIKE